MPNQKIRLGFIGLNPDRQWAASAHLPALLSLKHDFEIVGVANSSLESSKCSAQQLGIPRAFATPAELVRSPDIDVVVVTVKVPHHYELASAALNAGKHVYCEWPLGNGLNEAQELAKLAQQKGVVAVIGTQARTAAGVNQVRDLIQDGYVGRVLSTTLIGSAGGWTGQTTANNYYLYDARSGASMYSIVVGHTLDAMRYMLGDFGALNATFASNFETVQLVDTGEVRAKTVHDQVIIQGRMLSGAAVAIHYRGGMSRGTNLLWEINGTEGDIRLTADIGYPQIADLSVFGARGDEREMRPLALPHPPGARDSMSVAARNVAGIYELLAQDIRTGSRTAPSFADGVSLHELLARLEHAASRNI